jgi:transmembrane sensor
MPERSEDERLTRYIAGQCPPEEAADTQRWIAADPARWERFLALERAWRAAGDAPPRWDADLAWSTLAAARRGSRDRRGGGTTTPAPRVETPPPPPPLGLWSSAAPRARPRVRALRLAAVVVLAAVGAWLWTRAPAAPAPPAPAPLQEVATARGQRATIRLGDGSRVMLGAATTIRYPRGFGAGARRDVYLDGEAYFEVAHDPARPFAVHTARGTAEDIGTAFVVSAYPETHALEVVVASGAVALRRAPASPRDARTIADGDAPALTLQQGELGRLDSTGAATRRRVDDITPYLGWTAGELVFRGTPLRDALPAIGRWYDLDITLADTSLGRRRLVATFGRQPASDVVRLLALAIGARYERDGRSVVLRPRRAHSP